ncbi:hypothetical protein Tco_0822496 [Tanacetum coccineum]|uniref:Uncharacterized protein n=1 Tax=Tanacetum coccineum TaxID=301880 RepID=A0ABQ5AIA5_9ASTR
MANLPPNHNEFAPAAEAAPDKMNGWVEEEDPEMEEEDPEEDPEMEEEEEEMEMDADEEWDSPEWILPYQGADPLYPPPHASVSESEIEFEEAEAEAEAEVAPIPPHVPANPEPEAVTVWTDSSSSAAADAAKSHNPEDHTPRSYNAADYKQDTLARSLCSRRTADPKTRALRDAWRAEMTRSNTGTPSTCETFANHSHPKTNETQAASRSTRPCKGSMLAVDGRTRKAKQILETRKQWKSEGPSGALAARGIYLFQES